MRNEGETGSRTKQHGTRIKNEVKQKGMAGKNLPIVKLSTNKH